MENKFQKNLSMFIDNGKIKLITTKCFIIVEFLMVVFILQIWGYI